MHNPPWTASYPPGVSWDTPLQPRMLQDLLADAIVQWPDNNALHFMGQRTTYRALDALIDRCAAGLRALGVQPGVHVGLFLPNSPHYPIAFFGILRAGGTVVNYSPLDAARVLEHKIEDSQTDILITLDLAVLYPQMQALLGRTRLKTLVVGNLAEMSAYPAATRQHLEQSGQLATPQWDAKHLTFEQLLNNDGRYTPSPASDPEQTLAVLQYTGGTTGQPKGAMLTHGNISAAIAQFKATASGKVRLLTPGSDRILTVLPLFHIYALAMNMVYGLHTGAELILHLRFDVESVLSDLVNHRVTMFPAVPTMYTALLDRPGIEAMDFSALRFCSTGGAPVPQEVNRRFAALTGCRLYEGWGLTETSPAGTFTPITGEPRAGSCGVPVPGMDMRFASLDNPDQWAPLGERGEICVRGPNVMRGYWNNPGATAAAMTADGYLRTGDVGYMDQEGYVYIVDRTKDMILCSGYNVYPRILEEAIYEHPSVSEVSVIGVADAYRGQSPKAFVALKKGAEPFTLQALQAFLKDRLGKHEMVQALEIRDSLPKTPVGKLSKKELYDAERAPSSP